MSLVNIASEYLSSVLYLSSEHPNGLKPRYLSDKQLQYETRLRLKEERRLREAENMLPEPLRLDIMSLEGHESF